jgi:hypothetical protein
MTRPIEITDALSKVQAIERMQQLVRAVPENVQQFQMELNERISGEQTRTAQPAEPGDQIILHGDEHEKEQRREDENRDTDSFEHQEEMPGEPSFPEEKRGNPPDHIDIRI